MPVKAVMTTCQPPNWLYQGVLVVFLKHFD